MNARFLTVPVFFSLGLIQAYAHSYGPLPRLTAAPGDNAKACTICHAGTPNSFTGSVNIVLQSGPVYIPGVKQRILVQLSDAVQQRWGFELSARLNSDLANGQAGQLIPVDNFTQVICEDSGPQPCSTPVTFIQHTSAGTRNGTKGGATFQFDWNPPASNVGPVTLYVAGNAANGDANLTGDHIFTSSVQLNPVTPVAPMVTAGNILSAATSAPGPVAANSWVAIYGTNLAATSRAWNASDLTNGLMPVSLDGVSVIVTAFGAPRLAYVGYVSPTQVNILMPTDSSSTTYQVQVRNPAGITPQVPLVVAANAPQMLTLDGKYASGSHADGTILGKPGVLAGVSTTPAAPGETITLYTTGCGATSPAQVPGLQPAIANSLVTLPQVTIGGTTATVASASVLPGTGGVYQIKVQVPSNAINGDLPVVVQVGTGSSSPVLLTVQK